MVLKKYHCTHCGKQFESEEREIMECPGCFWSTSVRPGVPDLKPAFSSGIKAASKTPSSKLSFSFNLRPWLKPLAVVALAALIGAAWVYFRPDFPAKQKKSTSAAILDIPAIDGRSSDNPKLPALSAEELSLTDQQTLSRRVDVESKLEPSPKQKEILAQEASFLSGSVQRLPSRGWSEETFLKMLVDQERGFGVSFPRSYRNKILDLFRTQYLAGAVAFEAGDLLQARNAWVGSLAFPLYSTDIMKHRGVALTMLRPFINDTLSKIGALNTMLVEGQLRSREKEISADYREFQNLLEQGAWTEAFQSAEKLQKKIAGFEQSVTPESAAPPYPESIRQVDRDIAVTLFDILTPQTPPMSNLVPISEDLKVKQKVLETLLPEKIEEQRLSYEKAIGYIQANNWPEAQRALKGIQFPPSLAEDAAAKLSVIEKLQNQNLDSVSKSG